MMPSIPFELHPNLATKDFICDLPVCRVLLENNRHYPWLILVPRVDRISRMIQLDFSKQIACLQELDQIQNILWTHFKLTQLNIAALGNKTPQLHFHVIGRSLEDPAWPHTVWDHPLQEPYTAEDQYRVIHILKTALQEQKNH